MLRTRAVFQSARAALISGRQINICNIKIITHMLPHCKRGVDCMWRRTGSKEERVEMEIRVPGVEYRGEDGAWYDVSVQLRDDHGKNVLNIHYEGFSDRTDEQIAVEDLPNVQEIEDKFRLASKQLKDKYCRKVTNGMNVCASSDWEDTKFFDACVQEVSRFTHMLVNEEEQCMCRYKVLWIAGPCVGETTTIHCENIRLLQVFSIQRHPVLREFVQMIQGNMDQVSLSSGRNDSLSEPTNPHLDSLTTGEAEQSVNLSDDGCSEDIFLMSDKGEQGELGQEGNEGVRNCNSGSNSLASKDEISRTLAELSSRRRCEVPVVNGIAFSTCDGNGDDLSLMRKAEKDCLPDLNEVPNHLQVIQQLIPTNTEGIVNDLSQCKELKDADAHISAKDCFIPGESSTKKHATTGKFSMPGVVVNIDLKDLGKLSTSVKFPVSMIPSYGGRIDGGSPDIFSKGINGEKEGKNNNIEIADETGSLSLNQGCVTPNGHDIKRNLSFLLIENEKRDFESSGVKGRLDAATQKHEKIQEITPNDVTMDECTASSLGRNKRSKHRENEMFDSDNHVWNNKHIVESRQGVGTSKFPINNSVEIDASSSAYLKVPYLEYRKEEQEHNACEYVGMMPRKVEKFGNGVQVSMLDRQIKQPLSKETQSTEDFSEAVNMVYGDQHGDAIRKTGSIHEHKRSCRPSESDIQLQRSSCATVEHKGILLSNDQCKYAQGNCCSEREENLQKGTSKCKDCKHTLFMQSQDAYRSDIELHSCCMEFSSSCFDSDALCRASLRDSCEDRDGCHYQSCCKLNYCSCSCAIHSRASELHSKSRSYQNCNQHVHVACCSNPISAGLCHKGSNCMKAQYEHSAKGAACECFKDQSRLHRGALGLDGDTSCSNDQSKRCGCHSLHCNECDTCSFHFLGDGNQCQVSSECESVDLEGTNELNQYGHCNLCAHRSSRSCRKVNASGKAVIVEEVRYNSMQRAVREIYVDSECRHGVKEDLKVEARVFPSSQVLLLENLEKDVTPLDVLSVIHKATCGLVQVCISQSYKFEQFTRGFVCFEDSLSLQKALAFLQDEDIFIASSNGRPWVVLSVENGLYDGFYGDFTIGSKIVQRACGTMPSNKIKIYQKGTPGYQKAKLLKGIFLDLKEHTMLLHRRLEHEESKI